MDATYEGSEFKRADKLALGDYLPFKHQSRGQGVVHWLPIVAIAPKRTRIWITVEDESTGDRWQTRPSLDTQMRFKEVATIIEQTAAPGAIVYDR